MHTIAEAAELAGLTPDTLRYYERDGLMLGPVPRSSSGHRVYGPDEMRWIHMVSCLRATGMPIRGVREYAALIREGDTTAGSRLDLLRDHREAVLAQLAETQQHLLAIERKIALYEDQVATAA